MKAEAPVCRMYGLYFILESSSWDRWHLWGAGIPAGASLLRGPPGRFVCSPGKPEPPKHVRIPGLRPHGSFSSLSLQFVQSTHLQTEWGKTKANHCPSDAQGVCGWRPWARREPTVQEKQRFWVRWGINTSRALEKREMLSGAQGASYVCQSTKSYTKIVQRNSLEGQRRRGKFFPKATFHVFSV